MNTFHVIATLAPTGPMPEVLQFVNCALQRISIPGQGSNSDAPCTIFCGSHPTFHILCSGSLIQLLKMKFILFIYLGT